MNGNYGSELVNAAYLRISGQEHDAQMQVQEITGLADLPLMKEEKDVLRKWRDKWNAEMEVFRKSAEKKLKQLDKDFQRQQKKELDKISKKDAPKILFISLAGKKQREEAAQTLEYKKQESQLQSVLNNDLVKLEKEYEAQVSSSVQLLCNKISQYRDQIERRIVKGRQELERLKEAPYLFRVAACNGDPVTGEPEQEIRFEVWVREDQRTRHYIEQNEFFLLSNPKNSCGLWVEGEFRQYLEARHEYIKECAYQNGYEEGNKDGFRKGRKKGFEEGRRAGLEAQIDDEVDEAFDELFDDDEEFDDFPDDESEED